MLHFNRTGAGKKVETRRDEVEKVRNDWNENLCVHSNCFFLPDTHESGTNTYFCFHY